MKKPPEVVAGERVLFLLKEIERLAIQVGRLKDQLRRAKAKK